MLERFSSFYSDKHGEKHGGSGRKESFDQIQQRRRNSSLIHFAGTYYVMLLNSHKMKPPPPIVCKYENGEDNLYGHDVRHVDEEQQVGNVFVGTCLARERPTLNKL